MCVKGFVYRFIYVRVREKMAGKVIRHPDSVFERLATKNIQFICRNFCEATTTTTSLWCTKTFPHYLVMENHLDPKDGDLEWPLCFLVYQGGVKKKIISREVGLKLKHFYVDKMRFLFGTTYR